MGRYHSIIGIANGVDEYFRKAKAYISRAESHHITAFKHLTNASIILVLLPSTLMTLYRYITALVENRVAKPTCITQCR
jgi:hypothetical protein